MNLAEYHQSMNKGRNKYGAVKTEYNGVIYASRAEANRASELYALERAGVIRNIVRQRKYPIIINGIKVFTYLADFNYFDIEKDREVVEDVKGVRTAMFNLKKKCVEASYGIEIILT